MYPIEIQQIDERFFRQAYETVWDNIDFIKNNELCTISAFNHTIDDSGVCPTLTTRPDGFKTAILLVTKNDSSK